MLSTTIPSYLYTQYADDEDLQAFVAAYNQATQSLITWFATVGLPYYPGLTAPLLQWVVEGLYGLEATSLASPASTAIGPINTYAINTLAINGFTPSVQQFYTLTDDALKRILTWDFYKGDGKRFSVPWLKRRVMRFLIGYNGIDPQPTQPGFTVGAENTQAISVSFSGQTLTVTIYQTLLSAIANVSPNILSIFAAAFTGGYLDLPVEFNYAVNIVSPLVLSISPQAVSSSGTATTQNTPSTTVTPTGGSGLFTFAWVWASGGAGITINDPNSATSNFTATGMTQGDTYSGLAQCTVTDTVTDQTAIATCQVTIACFSNPILLAGSGAALASGAGNPLTVG